MHVESPLAELNQDDPETHEQPKKPTATEWHEQLFQSPAPQDEWPLSFDGEHQLDDATGMTSWQGV